jgi:hypothetical protein
MTSPARRVAERYLESLTRPKEDKGPDPVLKRPEQPSEPTEKPSVHFNTVAPQTTERESWRPKSRQRVIPTEGEQYGHPFKTTIGPLKQSGLYPSKRQKNLRGVKKLKKQRAYRKNRNKYKVQQKKRYRKMRNRPDFKRKQKARRKSPSRFKRRNGESLTSPIIAFVLGPNLDLGYVRNISPMSGSVTYQLEGAGLQTRTVTRFLCSVTFLSEADIEAMFELIDTEIGLDAYYDIDQEDLRETLLLEGIDETDPNFSSLCENLTGSRFEDMDLEQVSVLDQAIVDGMFGNGVKSDTLKRMSPKSGPEDEVDSNANLFDLGFESREASFSHRVAVKMAEIEGSTATKIHQRASQVPVKLVRASPQSGLWLFKANDKYDVKLKGIKKGNAKRLGSMDVQASCTCNFWQWQGPEHWASQKGYLFGKPRGSASKPNVRDPSGEHGACKHVLACIQVARNYAIRPPISRKMGNRKELSHKALADRYLWLCIKKAAI